MTDIYEPLEDSYLLEKVVLELARGKCLDMGTGSGILALAAIKKCSRLLAVDINTDAVSKLRAEVKKNGISRISVRQSDLFSNITEKFDTIIFNPPYLPTDTRYPDVALDGGPKGNELILKFLKQVKTHLKPGGQILLLFSTHTGKRSIDDSILFHNFLYKQVASEKLDFEELFVYQITEKQILGKGKRGVVHLETWKGKQICVKEELPGMQAKGRLDIEAQFLKKLNKHTIGPKMYFFSQGRLGMEYIKGEQILEYLKHASKEEGKRVLLKVFSQLYILDKLKINKFEMTNPYKHIIVKKNKAPVMIDFERCKHTQKPKNVTQFVEFIRKKKLLPVTRLTDIAIRKYKKDMNDQNYKGIIDSFSPDTFNQRVYMECIKIPKGKVSTYRELAHKLGTKAYRAVGNAMNKNPYAPEVPCHRVIASDGTIGGFASGTKKKIALLKSEGVEIKNGYIDQKYFVHS